MSELKFIDKNDQLPTLADVQSALHVIRNSMVTDILKLPPILAVELPNNMRCLQMLERIMLSQINQVNTEIIVEAEKSPPKSE